MPGTQRPARMRLQALRDEHAIVGIERHDIGHRAERHEIEERSDAGRPRQERAALVAARAAAPPCT